MDLADWRKKIDALDRELVRLLNERARCVAEIGKIKRANSLPIQESSREQEVRNNVLDSNQGPLENEQVWRVFQQIMEEGKSLQRRLMQQTEPEPPRGSRSGP
jgi:chorismate mutase-like protein